MCKSHVLLALCKSYSASPCHWVRYQHPCCLSTQKQLALQKLWCFVDVPMTQSYSLHG